MADTTCHFKREVNPKPILPLCRDNLDCQKFELDAHRKKFYHTTFHMNHEERLNFLLASGRYIYGQNPSFSGNYLWEQFSCDLKEETYYQFLLYCIQYIHQGQKRTNEEFYKDVIILGRAFSQLQIPAIYSNKINLDGVLSTSISFIHQCKQILKKANHLSKF